MQVFPTVYFGSVDSSSCLGYFFPTLPVGLRHHFEQVIAHDKVWKQLGDIVRKLIMGYEEIVATCLLSVGVVQLSCEPFEWGSFQALLHVINVFSQAPYKLCGLAYDFLDLQLECDSRNVGCLIKKRINLKHSCDDVLCQMRVIILCQKYEEVMFSYRYNRFNFLK